MFYPSAQEACRQTRDSAHGDNDMAAPASRDARAFAVAELRSALAAAALPLRARPRRFGAGATLTVAERRDARRWHARALLAALA
eukprot:6023544-Pleurochrysis_carterae.AAC.1